MGLGVCEKANGLHVFIGFSGGLLLVFIMLFMANACCSIEHEPKTLNQLQLHHARELAADAIEKMEPNEASDVFSEGLRDTEAVKETKKKTEEGVGQQCQCSCAEPNNLESPDQGPSPASTTFESPFLLRSETTCRLR